MNNMNFKIPFYGKKGTIKDIKEDTKFYKVYRYGLSEKEENIFYVPKNDGNLEALLDNYYSDLKGYLDANADKYETYKKSRLNKKVNLNTVKAMIGVSGLLILSSIPLFNTHEPIGFVGVLLDTVAIPTALYSVNEIVNKKKDEKKARYITKYNQFQHKYQTGIEKHEKEKEKTTYKGVVINDKDKKPIVDISKVRSLKQDTRKNVA